MKNDLLFTDLLKSDENKVLFSKIEYLDIALYKLSKAEFGLYTPKNISLHIKIILENIYDYKTKGFVDSYTSKNKVFEIVFRTFPEIFNFKTKELINFIESYNDLILLLLYKDIQCLEKNCILSEKDDENDLYFSVIDEKINVYSLITPDLRRLINLQRIKFFDRIYTGFDTEFETIEYTENKLLCFTTSTFSRFVFIIKKLKNVESGLLSKCLNFLVLYSRCLRDFNDYFYNFLELFLNVKVKEGILFNLENKTENILFFNKNVNPDLFKNYFSDLRNNSTEYSIEKILEI